VAAERRAAHTHIDGDIENVPGNHAYQLALGLRVLQM
jgi:hypothetical protein